MIKLRDSSKDVLVLVFDNCNEGRFPLSIALSEDGGKSWDHIRDLEPDVDFDHEQPNRDKHTNDGDGEYSYPSIQEDGIHDGLIHVAYTFRRETIKYSAFMTDWIKDNSEEAKSIGKVQRLRTRSTTPCIRKESTGRETIGNLTLVPITTGTRRRNTCYRTQKSCRRRSCRYN